MKFRALLISFLLLCGCGSRETAPSPVTEIFRDAGAETGLRFEHKPFPSGKYYMPEIMGAGAALFDYDNDGDLDAYLIQGTPLEGGRAPGESSGNRLFRNELVPGGQLRFTDVSRQAAVDKVMYGMGAATGDYDNDGFIDLYVTGFGPNVLYHNDGDGTFTDVTAQARVQDDRWSTSAAFVDYDRDGDLDLFVLNYVDFTIAGNKQCTAPSGEPDYCTPKAYKPVPARLFRNDGGGRFSDATVSSRLGMSYGPGLGVTCTDVNGDGWVDIYVANDSAANLLWINQKNGTFAEEGLMAGAAYSEDGLAKAGMGVTAGDFDNDGDDDLFVVNLTREGATLFTADGRGGFQDTSLRLGLRPLTFAYTGFGTDWFDYDNDGWLDLFIANGAVTIMESQRGSPWPFQQTNNLMRNREGKGFEDLTGKAGPAMDLAEVSRGAAFGDVDNDGDIDILVSNNSGPARLLLNQVGNRRPSLVVTLDRPWGARVAAERSDGSRLWRRAHADSSYLSASDPRVHFGRGAQPVTSLFVVWRDGVQERFETGGKSGAIYLRRGTGRMVSR